MNRDFFELLKGGLWVDYTPNSDFFSDSTDWSAIFELAKMQTVAALVWDGVERLPSELRPARKIALSWYGYVVRVAQSNELVNSRVAEIFTLYESNSLRPVLMKGASVATLYPNPFRRGCGDIDIYLGREQQLRADELLRQSYSRDELKEIKEAEQHSHFEIKGVSIENHILLNRFDSKGEKRVVERAMSGWYPDRPKYIDIDGVRVATIPDSFNAQYLYLHLMRHFMYGGIGLRQLCDLAIQLSHVEIDRRELFVNVGSWQVIERLLVRHLGLDPKHALFNRTDIDSKVDKILEYVIKEGNFGEEQNRLFVEGKRDLGFFSRKYYILKGLFGRYLPMMTIFPRESLRSLWITLKDISLYAIKRLFGLG